MIQEAMKIFSSEARAEDIELTYIEDDSMDTLEIDWVLLDPNRVLQVLFNLVTNAIKFTRARPERRISICLTGSIEVPSADTSGIAYVPRRAPRNLNSFDQVSCGAESVYLAIAVKDTGLGLTEQEKKPGGPDVQYELFDGNGKFYCWIEKWKDCGLAGPVTTWLAQVILSKDKETGELISKGKNFLIFSNY